MPFASLKKLSLFILVISVVLTGAAAMYQGARAQGEELVFIPFGGRILKAITCDSGILLTVGPPRGGEFFYKPGVSLLFAWYQIARIGVWAKGKAVTSLETCYVPCQNGRCPVGAGIIILMVGTSLK